MADGNARQQTDAITRETVPTAATVAQASMSTSEASPVSVLVRRTKKVRTRSGCLTCRRRRKKCDETTPVCLGCERNQLLCQWPEKSAKNAVVVAAPPPPSRSDPTSKDTVDDVDATTSTGKNALVALANSNQTSVLPTSLTPLPAMLRQDNSNRRLFDHFVAITARRLAVRANVENPFLTYNAQIGFSDNLMLHTILATTASHLVFDEEISDNGSVLGYGNNSGNGNGSGSVRVQRQFDTLSKMHYAIALRGTKHALTRWAVSSAAERLVLLATVFALCWYEVMDINTQGALYHHLRASKYMLDSLVDENGSAIVASRNSQSELGLLGFFQEQYAYLILVSHIGIGNGQNKGRNHGKDVSKGHKGKGAAGKNSGGAANQSRHDLPPPNTWQTLNQLNEGTPIYGCLLGCSHQLYRSIQSICDLADARREEEEGLKRRRREEDDGVDDGHDEDPVPEEAVDREPSPATLRYAELWAELMQWQPAATTTTTTTTSTNDNDDASSAVVVVDRDLLTAGNCNREACLVFLHASFHGPRPPTPDLYELIEPSLARFLDAFQSLSYEAGAWTTMLWPVLVAGSCMRDPAQRARLEDIIVHATIRMRLFTNGLRLLHLLWEAMDVNAAVYGPFGFNQVVLEQYNLDPCVG